MALFTTRRTPPLPRRVPECRRDMLVCAILPSCMGCLIASHTHLQSPQTHTVMEARLAAKSLGCRMDDIHKLHGRWLLAWTWCHQSLCGGRCLMEGSKSGATAGHELETAADLRSNRWDRAPPSQARNERRPRDVASAICSSG